MSLTTKNNLEPTGTMKIKKGQAVCSPNEPGIIVRADKDIVVVSWKYSKRVAIDTEEFKK